MLPRFDNFGFSKVVFQCRIPPTIVEAENVKSVDITAATTTEIKNQGSVPGVPDHMIHMIHLPN